MDTNLFTHAPKELVTDAFFTWLMYFLDSEERYEKEKNIFFKNIILKKDDAGKKISIVKIYRQDKKAHGRTDIILKFKIEGKEQFVLFENKTRSSTTSSQLNGYKIDNPNFYKYIYLKLAYINFYEKKLAQKYNYSIIDVKIISDTLSKIQKTHLFIEHYLKYINSEFRDNFIKNLEKLKNKEYSVLSDNQIQEYMISELYKKLDDKIDNLSFKCGSRGLPYTELHLVEKKNIYDTTSEYIFWRIDYRSNKFHIKLVQYAYIDKKFKEQKLHRLNKIREITREITEKYDLNIGKVSNSGTHANEIVIFYFKDNSDSLMGLPY